jgi:hypothetical protein
LVSAHAAAESSTKAVAQSNPQRSGHRQFFATAVPSEPFPGTPASLVAYPKEDIPRWAEAYKLSKIEPQ